MLYKGTKSLLTIKNVSKEKVILVKHNENKDK